MFYSALLFLPTAYMIVGSVRCQPVVVDVSTGKYQLDTGLADGVYTDLRFMMELVSRCRAGFVFFLKIREKPSI